MYYIIISCVIIVTSLLNNILNFTEKSIHKYEEKSAENFQNDKDTQKMVNKNFRNKSFRSAEKPAKRTSSCLLDTSHVTKKLTAFCG